MDGVDFELACDCLHVFNSVLKSSTEVIERINVDGSLIENVNI